MPYKITSTGGDGGVLTVGSFSASAQTNGASISGTTITFGPADASTPGMISTGSQVFTGVKRFTTAVHIGTAPSANIPLSIDAEPVLMSGAYLNWFSIARKTATANFSESIFGVYGQAYLNIGSYNSTGQTVGTFGETKHYGTGTVSNGIGVRGSVTNASTGTITNAISIRASTNVNSGGGTITSAFGFYTNDQTAGTSNYGYYSAITAGSGKYAFYDGGGANNYFAGDITGIRSVAYSWPASQGGASTYLQNDGSGNLSWASVSASPGGSTTQFQYNNAGAFGGASSFVYDNTTGVTTLTPTGSPTTLETLSLSGITTFTNGRLLSGTIPSAGGVKTLDFVSGTSSGGTNNIIMRRTSVNSGTQTAGFLIGHYNTTSTSHTQKSLAIYDGSLAGVYGYVGQTDANSNTSGGAVGISQITYQGNYVVGGQFGGILPVGTTPQAYGVRCYATGENSAQQVGIYARIYTTQTSGNESENPGTSGAAIFSNGDTSNRVIGGYDGTTLCFEVADGGTCTLGASGGTTTHTANGHLSITGQGYSGQDTETQGASTTHTIDWNDGNSTVWDLQSATGNITLTLSNPVAGASYIIKIIQSSTARTVTWPAAVLWPGGSAPTLTTTNDGIDIVTLYYDGTNYLGSFGLDYQ